VKLGSVPDYAPESIKTPAGRLEYEREYLCFLVVKLADKAALLDVLQKEKMLCKPSLINFTLQTDQDEADIAPDFGDVEEDVLDAIVAKEQSSGESYNPFSYDGMDYNGSNE
jgi:hypothetical protein